LELTPEGPARQTQNQFLISSNFALHLWNAIGSQDLFPHPLVTANS